MYCLKVLFYITLLQNALNTNTYENNHGAHMYIQRNAKLVQNIITVVALMLECVFVCVIKARHSVANSEIITGEYGFNNMV